MGKDTIEGGSGDDTLLGAENVDTYVFNNNYGTDTLSDTHGYSSMDFSGVTHSLNITMTDAGFTADAGSGNSLVVPFDFISINDFISITEIKIGTGNDTLTVSTLPAHQLDIIDAGGSDYYGFTLDQADTSQSIARVNVVDNNGSNDRIDL